MLTAWRALSRLGWDAQAIFQNPDQVLQFVGAGAFLAEVFFQSLYLLLERGFIGGGRSRWVAGLGLAGPESPQRDCWSWSRWNWTGRKQLRWLCGRLEQRSDQSCGVMNRSPFVW